MKSCFHLLGDPTPPGHIESSWSLNRQVPRKPKTLGEVLTDCPKCGAVSVVEGPYTSTIPGQEPVSKRTIRCPHAKGKQPVCSVTVEVVGPAEGVKMPWLNEQQAQFITDSLNTLGWTKAKLAEKVGMLSSHLSSAVGLKQSFPESKYQKAIEVLEAELRNPTPPPQPIDLPSQAPPVPPVVEVAEAGAAGDDEPENQLDRIESKITSLRFRVASEIVATDGLSEEIWAFRQELGQLLTRMNERGGVEEGRASEPLEQCPYVLAKQVENIGRRLMKVDSTGSLLLAAFKRAAHSGG